VGPPDRFETSRKRRLREEAETIHAKRLEERVTHELAYEDYRREAIDSYIAANFSKEAYQDLIECKKQELAPQYKRMTAWQPEGLLKFLKGAVRADNEELAAGALARQAFELLLQ
jgi:hypothetical protein